MEGVAFGLAVAGGDRTGHLTHTGKQAATPRCTAILMWKGRQAGRALGTPAAKGQGPSKGLQRTPKRRHWVGGDQEPRK